MHRSMEQKKYELASVLADSAKITLNTVQSILSTKGRATASESLGNVKTKLENLNELLNSDTFQQFGTNRKKVFHEKYDYYQKNAVILVADFEDSYFLRVHKNSQKLSKEIDVTIQRLNKSLEQTVNSQETKAKKKISGQ